MGKNMEHKATHLDVFDSVFLWATNQCIKPKIMTYVEKTTDYGTQQKILRLYD